MAMSLKFFNIPPPYGSNLLTIVSENKQQRIIIDCFTAGSTRKRKQVKRACSNCKLAHAGCDAKRPCSRCIAKKQEATCHEWTPEDDTPTSHNPNQSQIIIPPITNQVHSEPILQKRMRGEKKISSKISHTLLISNRFFSTVSELPTRVDNPISITFYSPETMEQKPERRSNSDTNLNIQFTSEFPAKKRLLDYPSPVHLNSSDSGTSENFKTHSQN
jgi:hypothetical protein